MPKLKPPALLQKQHEQVNKKAIVWVSVVVGVVLIGMIVLLIANG